MSCYGLKHTGLWKKIFVALICVLIFGLSVYALVNSGEDSNVTKSNGKLTVDMTHVTDGYFTAYCVAGEHKMKMRVSFGSEQLTYDLNNEGTPETFPLQFGSGQYTVMLYENTAGKKYSQAGKVVFNAQLEDEMASFLYPNQYVNYTEDTEAVKMAKEVCEVTEEQTASTGKAWYGTLLSSGAKSASTATKTELTDTEKFEAIKKLIKDNFTYDYVLACTVKSGALPDIDTCCEKHTGICQDLSATAVCMLRSQGIHAKLVIGYADTAYHAWVLVYIDGEEIQYDPTVELHAMKKPKTYTTERYY